MHHSPAISVDHLALQLASGATPPIRTEILTALKQARSRRDRTAETRIRLMLAEWDTRRGAPSRRDESLISAEKAVRRCGRQPGVPALEVVRYQIALARLHRLAGNTGRSLACLPFTTDPAASSCAGSQVALLTQRALAPTVPLCERISLLLRARDASDLVGGETACHARLHLAHTMLEAGLPQTALQACRQALEYCSSTQLRERLQVVRACSLWDSGKPAHVAGLLGKATARLRKGGDLAGAAASATLWALFLRSTRREGAGASIETARAERRAIRYAASCHNQPLEAAVTAGLETASASLSREERAGRLVSLCRECNSPELIDLALREIRLMARTVEPVPSSYPRRLELWSFLLDDHLPGWLLAAE